MNIAGRISAIVFGIPIVAAPGILLGAAIAAATGHENLIVPAGALVGAAWLAGLGAGFLLGCGHGRIQAIPEGGHHGAHQVP